jgi:uncharacterized LabA/DUF88 family protein
MVAAPQRVVAYVDGFNLYYGLKAKEWQRFYWLDVAKLCRSLLSASQSLAAVKYFTARISSPADKARRQGTYLEALETRGECSVHYGRYLDTSRRCPFCGRVDTVPKEKMTDLLIGLEVFGDALADSFDTALLVSGDSDLVAVVDKVHHLLPGKRVAVAFPPLRHSRALAQAADVAFMIGRAKFSASQLPCEVVKPGGHVLKRPDRWT